MSLKEDILSALISANHYISGEELALKYGKSRAAVWKAIKSLQAEGYGIDAVTNKGYLMTDSRNMLSAQGIGARLVSSADVLCYKSVDSTNNVCKRLLVDGKEGVFLVVANEQTAGRGRQGKSFYSPADTGIYFSLVLHPNTKLSNAVTATTAAAVAVCKAIESLTDTKPKIKWVNDVYLDGRKICGILTEAITDFEAGIVESIIIGIGINISTESFPDDIVNAGSLNLTVDRNALVAKVTDELIQIATGDYKRFIDYYRSHSLVIGKQIRFVKNGVATLATAIEIDETGGLVVELSDNTRTTLNSGEISILL